MKNIASKSRKHSAHTYDDYLDDTDFINFCNYIKDDYENLEYMDIFHELNDFIHHCGDDFGYKYPEFTNLDGTITNILNHIENELYYS